MGTFQKFCLRWNNHSSNFAGNLGSLLVSEEYSDVTVCCQGEVWHLHQLVLSASSSHFAQLLRHIPAGQTPILILDGPPATDVHALIHFIYHGEVNVDQDSLPSLLRTASSLRIKGLADVTGLTQELSPDSFPSDGELVASTTVGELPTPSNSVTFEEMSPLNLSCNKNNDMKQEQDVKEEVLPKHTIQDMAVAMVDDPESKGNLRKEASEVFFHPPPKRIRTQEPITVAGPTTVPIVTPSNSQALVTEPVYTTVSSSLTKCKSEVLIPPCIDSCHKKDPVPQKLITVPVQQQQLPLEKVRVLPPKGSTTYYKVPLNASFPLLNMAHSPHIAYQQSSTTQPSLEVIRPDPNPPVEVTAPISSISNIPQQSSDVYEAETTTIKTTDPDNSPLHKQTRLQPVQDTMTSIAIYNASNLLSTPVEICSSNVNEHQEKLKTEEKVISQNFISSSPGLESNNTPEVPEKTFNHKKFSPCTIPNSNPPKKTIHVVRGVYASTPVTTPYKVKNEGAAEPVTINNDTHINKFNPEILIQSSNVVKLTPVAVTSYTSNLNNTSNISNTSNINTTCNINNTFPTNSIIYTASSGSSFKANETTLPNATCTNVPVQSTAKGTTTVGEDKSVVFAHSNPSPQEASESTEISSSSSSSSSGTTYPPSSVNVAEGTTQNAQRVTINMRTFKEEWRRQLLVDYDSRTNMSICMLCYTTFKSYDGPRKNTYVKHAKRFHPALEDYSEEERGIIISMYENHHKYDIDMQKEINKSFRTTNSSGSSLKRIKISDSGLPISVNSNHSNRLEIEGESSEEKGDSASESKNGENYIITRDMGSAMDATTGPRCSDKEDIQDTEAPSNNNNNNLNDNNNKRKTEFHHRDPPITS